MMSSWLFRVLLLLSCLLLVRTVVSVPESNSLRDTTGRANVLDRAERVRLNKEAPAWYMELRRQGVDEVSHTAEAAAMRHYRLRKKKRRGLLRKRDVSLARVLFPGVSPVEYALHEDVIMFTDMVKSNRTQVPFHYYDMPVCRPPAVRKRTMRMNLGSRLQGLELKPAPFMLKVKQDYGCRPLCQVHIGGRKLRWMRKLVERQYRVHLTFDQLPVLMRSRELNYAVQGFPIGFQDPYTGLKTDEFYLYNHLKFTITYTETGNGVHITGFDVHPVSFQHKLDEGGAVGPNTEIETCNADGAPEVINDPSTYLPLRAGPAGEDLQVIYSYAVEWKKSQLPWADRWDVYLLGSPDDDIHYFAIVNSLMIVLFLTGMVASIIVYKLRKDIAGDKELQKLELVQGDVFRPPQFSPMLLSVLVGTGAQIGTAVFLCVICAVLKLLNPLTKGQTLTAILVLYVLSGSVAGYVSARLYKFCGGNAWKLNAMYTAAGLPGTMVCIFFVLNIVLIIAGAATAVSIWTVLRLCALWVCVSTPLVFLGSYLGFRAQKMEVPTITHQVARVIPVVPWLPFSVILGGILPFGSVCIELFFIMSALWLHQIYYEMGFLLPVLLLLGATSAEVAIVLCFIQLCMEDHRWWWKSFWNCASAGGYLFLYSHWFLSSRLDLVGVLSVMVYLTYMAMILACFALFCGVIGFLTCFWFNKTVYEALKFA